SSPSDSRLVDRNMSSAASAKNKIDRAVKIAGQDRLVRQQWRKEGRAGFRLRSVLLAKNTKKPLGGALTAVVADRDALVTRGKEHVEAIRERAEKIQSKSAAVAEAGEAPLPRKRATADTEVAATDPLEAEQHSG
ncbi:unnamed protein product, partial [Pylaiella littoralis]